MKRPGPNWRTTALAHTPARGRLGACLWAALFAALTFPGCERAEPAHPPARTQAAKAAVVVPPKRLTKERFEALRNVRRAPLPIPLEHAGPLDPGTNVRVTDGALEVKNEEAPPSFVVPIACDAADYSELRVRMRVRKGRRCWLTWQSDLEPTFDHHPHACSPILADDAPHTYVISLRPPNCDHWAGAISSLAFFPSDEPTSAVITKLELVSRAPDRPRALTIRDETHEALFGTQTPWAVTIPENAQFEVHFGMQERSWEQCAGDGVRFSGRLTLDTGQEVPLFSKTLDPVNSLGHRRWLPARADLAPYAGQTAEIHLDIDPLITTDGDYAYWGNPMVFCQEQPPETTEESGPTPVILISCDTLRADHLSCYGYGRKTTPYLDRWTSEAVLFEHAATNCVWTLTSHATMLTGLYPKSHGADLHTNIAENANLLAEVLRDAGYVNLGLTGHRWLLLPERGFGRGFDYYSTPTKSERRRRDVFDVFELAWDWLDAHPTPRFFAFLHNYDIHSKPANADDDRPYLPAGPAFLHFSNALGFPPTFEREVDGEVLHANGVLAAATNGLVSLSDDEHEYVVALYDDCVRAVDQAIGEFLEALRQRGLYDAALIIVTADHGESMDEHGAYLHNDVYESCAHVPLIVKFPHGRFAGRRVPQLVELCDLYPTVLEVLALPADPAIDGQSLLALLEGRMSEKPYAFTRKRRIEAVRSTEWKLLKYLDTGEYGLYHLASDPGEQRNLYEKAPPVLDDLRKVLKDFYGDTIPGWRVTLVAGAEPCAIDVRLTLIQSAEHLYRIDLENDDVLALEDRQRRAQGRINLAPGQRNEFILHTYSREPLQVALTGTAPFAVDASGESHQPDTHFHTILDPALATARAASAQTSDRPRPSVTITWIAPTTMNQPAGELSPAAEDELKALGYVE